ncbi:MAG: RimK family alpha-L-glutamate ligase [Bacteroidia bacterium]
MRKIYVIHENEAWLPPLRQAFEQLNLPYEEWNIGKEIFDLDQIPPEGIFYNRMSASAHTRDHRYAPEVTQNILAWLHRHGRTVVNGRRALQLELRKSEQYLSLQSFGISHPKTIIANDENLLAAAAKKLNQYPFIIKPNRGGKGAGVQMFYSQASLEHAIQEGTIGESLDGIWLVQQYVKPSDGRITRAEFVGGEFLYAVSIDASNGFELCPADSCQIDDLFCPAEGSSAKFVVLDEYENEDLQRYARFLKENDIGVGALEYAKDESGQRFVYDVNTNTNYNSEAENESALGKKGMFQIARYLGEQLSFSGEKGLAQAA